MGLQTGCGGNSYADALFQIFRSARIRICVSQVGMEPEGRFATGIAELVAGILLLIPKTSFFGALLAFFIMIGAIATHVLILGVEVQEDNGLLFTYAVIATIASAYVIVRTTPRKRKVTF